MYLSAWFVFKFILCFSVFQFSTLLEDNANSKIDTTTEQAFAVKDKAGNIIFHNMYLHFTCVFVCLFVCLFKCFAS